jgi:hypothetical protein
MVGGIVRPRADPPEPGNIFGELLDHDDQIIDGLSKAALTLVIVVLACLIGLMAYVAVTQQVVCHG